MKRRDLFYSDYFSICSPPSIPAIRLVISTFSNAPFLWKKSKSHLQPHKNENEDVRHEEPFQNRLVLGAKQSEDQIVQVACCFKLAYSPLLIPRRYLLSVKEVRAVGTDRSRTATGRHLKMSERSYLKKSDSFSNYKNPISKIFIFLPSTASPPHANMLIFSC